MTAHRSLLIDLASFVLADIGQLEVRIRFSVAYCLP